MDWVDTAETVEKADVKPAETKADEKPAEVVKGLADVKVTEEKSEGDPPAQKPEDKPPEKDAEKPEDMVPQDVMGKALKKQRERLKEKSADKIAELEAENKRLREGKTETVEVDPVEQEQDQKIAIKVRTEFLRQQDAYGRKKYGQAYKDAANLVQNQNDPVLTNKIQWADDPAETLMREAKRIADEELYGSDPEIRQKTLRDQIREEERKKLDAEYAEKLKALSNQPSDVQKMRAAGGDVKPDEEPETWTTGKKPLPGG